MTEGVFEVGQLIRLRSGKCLLRVEGWADVEGEPKKLRVELEFQLRQIRARVQPLDVAEAAESMCPCEHPSTARQARRSGPASSWLDEVLK